MNITLLILLSFCLYSAMYYRSATRYLKLVFESNDSKVCAERWVLISPLLDGAKYIERTYVKILRALALIVGIVSCLLAFEISDWKGSLTVIFFGVGLALIRTKVFRVESAESYINRSNLYLIISIIIIIGVFISL